MNGGCPDLSLAVVMALNRQPAAVGMA